MYALANAGLMEDLGCNSSVFMQPTLNAFMETPSTCWKATRARLTALLGASSGDDRLKSNDALKSRVLVPSGEVQMHLPAKIGDYTDFYSSRDHATNVGIMIRGKDNALQPNWLHLPVGYHGRASSVVVSGTDVSRPAGQLQVDKADPSKGSSHGPCRLMDFELEMAFFVGGPSNAMGTPVNMENADDRIFGAVIMNDWSARDVQTWEYVPLGPFTSKNFATSISPWCVSIDALKGFACASSTGPVQGGNEGDPTPLPYITDPDYAKGLYDVELEITIQGASDEVPSTISRSNLKHMYWNFRQQLVHHAVTGCPMNAGDLLGTGTISGPTETSLGCMLELSWRGTRDVVCENGNPSVEGSKARKFLKDGDTVNMVGYAQGDGYRIGFGECKGKVLPAGGPCVLAAEAGSASGAANKYTLYSYWRSTSSWRVRIAMAMKGLQYEYKAVDLAKLVGNTTPMSGHEGHNGLPDKNPLSQVPLLVVEGNNGNAELTQSIAILQYIEDAHPNADASIFPADALAKARANQIAEIVNSGIQPLQNLSVLRCVTRASVIGGGEEDTVDGRGFAKSAIEKGLAAIEALVAANAKTSGAPATYAAGTVQPTIADICLVPQVYNAGRFGIDMAAYPHCQRVCDQCATLPAFMKAAPEAQPDAPAA
jgi:fumarylacetoacetase